MIMNKMNDDVLVVLRKNLYLDKTTNDCAFICETD
jgi:hypothetical protein